MINYNELAKTKNYSSLLELSIETLYANGGPVYIFIQLKNHGANVETLKEIAKILFQNHKQILNDVMTHL